ncbi:phage portal protein [Lactococcus lactis]|uniref:portal protein n=1 Tax=Lactococcus phage ul36 TaxID=114416 RepID=UPI000009C0F5|nr:phage portal protein [Lactococcus lactis]NP_663672.1 portal protein [Lactococcus phage ul36]ABD63672.1 putative portal protein [Lactococcus phage ul36.k1]AAM75785.1 putative portal protein [Lactococcus phage ul36]MCT0038452.1 phage portal protein [Lactococcus lactis subsp. lactis]MCT3140518.1 phage portal protein [Lactococcus lactis]MDM7656930.1 phage portal protein [Lactococcus lactis]
MKYKPPKLMTFPKDEPITNEVVTKFMEKHRLEVARYEYLKNMYRGIMAIDAEPTKDLWKPDNRLTVNFTKYIVDTFTGYFNGIPVKKSHSDKETLSKLQEFDNLNDMEDEESELAKMACIYGRAFELLYQNEETQTNVIYNTPENMFMVYDDTIKQEPLFAVRYGYDDDYKLYGEVYTKETTYALNGTMGFYNMTEQAPNPFDDLPVVEFYFNEERMSIFESVISLVNAFNKAISEKANDVDYFSDQYLTFLGAAVEEEDLKNIRSNRVINYYGESSEAKNVDVKFLEKPDSDSQTENLLDRLTKLIFQTTMVANISDESFGSSSGVSLAYKLQAMSNLALSFQRKFQSSLNSRYKLYCELSTNVSNKEAWKDIEYTFTRNEPKDIKEQAETANILMGITSQETALSVISVIPDVQAEMEKIKKEEASTAIFDKDKQPSEKGTDTVVPETNEE